MNDEIDTLVAIDCTLMRIADVLEWALVGLQCGKPVYRRDAENITNLGPCSVLRGHAGDCRLTLDYDS